MNNDIEWKIIEVCVTSISEFIMQSFDHDFLYKVWHEDASINPALNFTLKTLYLNESGKLKIQDVQTPLNIIKNDNNIWKIQEHIKKVIPNTTLIVGVLTPSKNIKWFISKLRDFGAGEVIERKDNMITL